MRGLELEQDAVGVAETIYNPIHWLVVSKQCGFVGLVNLGATLAMDGACTPRKQPFHLFHRPQHTSSAAAYRRTSSAGVFPGF